MKHRKNGFTLIELIVAMALVSIVVALAFNILVFGNKVQKNSTNEYNLQSSVRIATEQVNKIVRYSTALFTIPVSSFVESNLSAGWNYFGLSQDKSEIVLYSWNGTKHVKSVVVPSQTDLTYNLKFKKYNAQATDKLLNFTVSAGLNDSSSSKFSVDTQLEALNALQVVDRGTILNPATAIAFRTDNRPTGVYGAISLVMDKSGSMAWNLNGGDSGPSSERRISILKTDAIQMVNEFAKEENIAISLVPFEDSANNPNPFRIASQQTADLINDINGMTANGGTNTGDGMRRGYYRLKEFDANLASSLRASNYMIILVDGVSTFASVVSNSDRSDFKADGNINDTGYLDRTPKTVTSQIAGNGSSLDPKATAYVDAIGEMIRLSVNPIKVYVIGFSNLNTELASVDDIASAAGAPPSQVYRVSPSMDLSAIFTAIRQDILNDLWVIRGPAW